MNNTIISTNHPLIPNNSEYLRYRKIVSIHSEDRDILKYPNANEFEIMLPEDLLNVASIRLYDWSFPCNYNTFSNLFSWMTNSPLSFSVIMIFPSLFLKCNIFITSLG